MDVPSAEARIAMMKKNSTPPAVNGVARIFFGGGQFSVISGGRPDSVGGGGSSRNFPGSP